MDSELVGAPCYRLEFYQGHLLSPAQDAPLRFSVLSFINDPPVGSAVGITAYWRYNRTRGRAEAASNKGKVPFLDQAPAKVAA